MAGQILWAWAMEYYIATGAIGGAVTYAATQNTQTAILVAAIIIIIFKFIKK